MSLSTSLLVFVLLIAHLVSGEFTIPLERRLGPNGKIDYDTEIRHVAAKYANHAMAHFKNTGKHHQSVNGTTLRKRAGTARLDLADNYAWTGEIELGSPAQTRWVIFDSGSSDIVMNKGMYNHEDSTTSKDLNKKYSMNYVGGPASGSVYTDQVTIGGVKVKDVVIADNNDVINGLTGDKTDGILGLAFPWFSGLSDVSEPNFVDAAKQQKALQKNVYQLTTRMNGGSTLNIGKIDASEIDGDLGWVKVNQGDGYWKTDLQINGKKVTGIVDSGTSFVVAPADQYTKIMGGIDKLTVKKNDNGEYNGYYKCDDPPVIKFKLAGKETTMSEDAMYADQDGDQCRISIVSINGFNDWIFGSTFLATGSVVFDFDNTRLGFGKQT